MKNIIKYVLISFGLLFLASFLFIEKTYGSIPCVDDCDCGCNYQTGNCKSCPCPSNCNCGCESGTTTCWWPDPPTNCTCGYHAVYCSYQCNTVYSSPRTGCVRDANKCTSACECDKGYCLGDLECGSNTNGTCACSAVECPYGCHSDGSCKPIPTCSVYNSYCEEQNGAGSYSIWSEISQSCVCVEPPTTCQTGEECPDGSGNCCPANTTCEQFSGIWRCTDPEPPTPPADNTTPTAPTSLQTEGSTDPNKVLDLTPEFSAIFNDPDTGDASNYYQIQVNTNSSFTGTVMWNSNKTSMTSTAKGSRSPQLSYAGTALTMNGSLYYWRIKFWDVGGLESPWSNIANFKMNTTNTTPTAPTSLQTEGSTDPNKVLDLTPEFSAIFNDPDTSDSSNYYQIQVNTNSSFTGTVMWNSNKTSMTSTAKGSRSPQLSYAGTALTMNGSLYYWRIKFWDVGGLESPWSSVSKFRLCNNVDCNPSDYCKPNGWAPVPLTPESIPLEDIVHCTSVVNCTSTEKYGDCYEDPHLECTKDTDCKEGECCRGYTCTTDCTPVVLCNTDSECDTNKCCVGGECGKCISDDSQTLQLTVGSKTSGIVVVSLWDRILAMFRKLNTYFY